MNKLKQQIEDELNSSVPAPEDYDDDDNDDEEEEEREFDGMEVDDDIILDSFEGVNKPQDRSAASSNANTTSSSFNSANTSSSSDRSNTDSLVDDAGDVTVDESYEDHDKENEVKSTKKTPAAKERGREGGDEITQSTTPAGSPPRGMKNEQQVSEYLLNIIYERRRR